MKKEILDAPFRDSFSDFLEKGEEIVWTYSPNDAPTFIGEKGSNLGVAFLAMGFAAPFIFALLYWSFSIKIPIVLALLAVLLFFRKKRMQRGAKRTQYVITQKRIFFQLPSFSKNKIQEIPFLDLKSMIVTTNGNGLGTIFLVAKNPESVTFDTYALDGDETKKRHQPTLELIENPEEVAQLIRQGIQNANKVL